MSPRQRQRPPSYMKELAIKRKLDAIEKSFKRLQRDYEEGLLGNEPYHREQRDAALAKGNEHAMSALLKMGVAEADLKTMLYKNSQDSDQGKDNYRSTDNFGRFQYTEEFKKRVFDKLLEEKYQELTTQLEEARQKIVAKSAERGSVEAQLRTAMGEYVEKHSEFVRLTERQAADEDSINRHNKAIATEKAKAALQKIKSLQQEIPELERKFHEHAELVRELSSATDSAKELRAHTGTDEGMNIEETLSRMQSNIDKSTREVIGLIAHKKRSL